MILWFKDKDIKLMDYYNFVKFNFGKVDNVYWICVFWNFKKW